MSSSTVCAEQLQKFHSSQQKTHHLHNIDVPPRKLLSRRSRATSFNDDSSSVSTPKTGSAAEEALFRKFLPYNTGFDDDEDDPYSADHFRMFEFKIRRCTRSRSHDWTDCPFAHPGEKARRRDPRRVSYSGTVCPEFRRGACSKGDSCEFAHGVFECWLHPARYRTEACKDGKNCKRKVCFFAHTPKQLRILPPSGSLDDSPGIRKSSRKTHSSSSAGGCNHCCVFCLHHQSSGNSNNNPNSPTSTLLNFSPPHSPMKNRASDSFSPISRFGGINSINGSLSYDEALAELIASLDAIYVADDHHNNLLPGNNSNNYPWMDGSGEIYNPVNNHHHNQQQLQQTQFILSPSSPQESCFNPVESCQSNLFDPNPSVPGFYSSPAAASTGVDIDAPDVAWVDELLM